MPLVKNYLSKNPPNTDDPDSLRKSHGHHVRTNDAFMVMELIVSVPPVTHTYPHHVMSSSGAFHHPDAPHAFY